MNPTLGEFIRTRREELKLTQRQVAIHAGFKSLAHLSDIEGGKRNPGPEAMARLADILQVDLQELKDRDARAPLQATKDLLEAKPEMVAAFRRIVDHARELGPDELLRRIENPKSAPPDR